MGSCVLRLVLFLGSRLPKTRSMDDLLSACDSSSPLTRTSSDPNLNNHCQEVRAGLDARHAPAEGAELHLGEGSVAGEAQQVEEHEEKAALQANGASGSPAENREHREQPSGWAALPANRVSLEAEKGTGACPEELDGTGTSPAPCPSGQQNTEKVPTNSAKQSETCPQEPLKVTGVGSDGGACSKRNITCPDIPSQEPLAPSAPCPDVPGTAPGAPCLAADKGKGEAGRGMPCEEPGRPGRAPLEQWRRPISQSQSSEFSLLGYNWDSFQGMVTSLPNGEPVPRHLLSYGCCSKRLSSKPLRAPGLCLSGQWPGREGNKPWLCSGHVSSHFAGPTGKPSRSWLPCHLKQASGPKHMPPKCPSPVPPLYLDDDGLPFPTDVIQHRLRQIEASYKQEVEQLRRQVRELQLRLDIRHFCAPPAEPPMDYEDDFVSDCLQHPAWALHSLTPPSPDPPPLTFGVGIRIAPVFPQPCSLSVLLLPRAISNSRGLMAPTRL